MHKSQEASQGSAHLPQHQPLRVATHGCWCLSRAAASQGQVAMKSRKNGWHFATSFQALAQPPKWLMTALVGPLVPWLCKGAAADGDGVCCLGLFIAGNKSKSSHAEGVRYAQIRLLLGAGDRPDFAFVPRIDSMDPSLPSSHPIITASSRVVPPCRSASWCRVALARSPEPGREKASG